MMSSFAKKRVQKKKLQSVVRPVLKSARPLRFVSDGKTIRAEGDAKQDVTGWEDDVPKGDEMLKSSGGGGLAASLVNPNQVYRFRLTLVGGSVSSDAGGLIATVATCDPTSYSEFSDLNDLFTEIRLVRSVLHIAVYNPAQLTKTQPMVVVFNPAVTSTAPTSEAQLWAIPGARIMSLSALNPVTFNADISGNSWALFSAPVPGPYAGCYGAWQIYCNGVLNTSAKYFYYYLENEYDVRSRA